ncbi:hypothetical protein [Paenibacillus macquariensis]|nr:hypothetical protein [Paenibacillus macquariensis]MEC0090698.1 hypothetical protein [Paenibacillus macquariensis]
MTATVVAIIQHPHSFKDVPASAPNAKAIELSANKSGNHGYDVKSYEQR